MKLLTDLVLIAAAVAVSAAHPSNSFDGNSRDVSAFADDDSDITFLYFSKENPEEPILLANDSSIQGSTYNASRQTMIFVHGFLESANFDSVVKFREAYVKGYDHNVILVNYKNFSPGEGDIYMFYMNIGEVVCNFTRNLMDNFGLVPNDLHIIGHSVGVHVAGQAGKCLKRNKQLPRRLTGLDPANWSDLGETEMDIIRPGDAETVDCVHTSTSFGIHTPVCGCNFYPNGGITQPECASGALGEICDHLIAFKYYSRSIGNTENYPALRCKRVNADTGKVEECETAESAFMGVDADKYCEPNSIWYVTIQG